MVVAQLIRVSRLFSRDNHEKELNMYKLLATIIAVVAVIVPAGAETDALGCFARVYDRAHLAKHPDQRVTAVKLHIHRPPPEYSSTNGFYWFLVQFKVRGRDETLRSGGACREEAPGLMRCGVDCDGGGVNVAPRGDHAMMYLQAITVTTCGDKEEELTGGKDDRVFRLDRADQRVCRGMKP
jgi:hypothetical protein